MKPAIEPLQTRLAFEVKCGSPLIGCRFDPSGRYLFASSENFAIHRYDVATGQRIQLAGHSSWVRGLAFSGRPPIRPMAAQVSAALVGGASSVTAGRAESTLVSADYHGHLKWWNADGDSPTPIRSVPAHSGWARAVAISPDGTTIASCGNDGLVKLWAIADGKALQKFEGHGCHVYNVAFHPTGNSLVSGDLKGVIKEWDLASGKAVRVFDAKVLHKYDGGFAADIGGVRGMTFDATGASLACTGITEVSNAFAGVGNPLVVSFDWKDGKAKQLKPKDAFQGTGWGVGFLANGWIVAAGGAGQGRLWFWKPDEPASAHVINVPANARDLALHPDGTALAVAGANGSAYVYTMSPTTPAKKK